MKERARLQLMRAVDASVGVSAAEVDKFVNRARTRRPSMTDAELLVALERSYTGLVATTGAAAGGVAAAPGVTTGPGLALALADVGTFTVATATFVLAVASVHGITVDDLERRKALLLAAMSGPGGSRLVEKAAGRTGAHWGKQVTQTIPMSSIRQLNKILGHNFVTKYGTKQGVLVIGKVAPFGLGAAIGALGNATLATLTVRATRSAFGPLAREAPVLDNR